MSGLILQRLKAVWSSVHEKGLQDSDFTQALDEIISHAFEKHTVSENLQQVVVLKLKKLSKIWVLKMLIQENTDKDINSTNHYLNYHLKLLKLADLHKLHHHNHLVVLD